MVNIHRTRLQKRQSFFINTNTKQIYARHINIIYNDIKFE